MENAGLGAARNTGITHAKGKYTQFVDSDDYLEENVLPSLLHKMDNESLDILRFNYQNVNDEYRRIVSTYGTNSERAKAKKIELDIGKFGEGFRPSKRDPFRIVQRKRRRIK